MNPNATPPDDDPLPRAGLRVDGRYVLERLLGRGGMGEVWYARDEGGGGPVALKFVRRGEDAATPHDGKARRAREARLAREARAAQRVRHPNVVELYGVVDDPTYGPVLVMEYLEGEPLSARLERGGPLPLERGARLALELCEGLAAAHAVGVVHRDLKPDNVILVRDEGDGGGGDGGEDGWRACIVDFGVAKLLSTTLESISSTSGGFVGTPIYMAPEQLLAEGDVDHRADLWSLGLVLFASLTGRTPTAGEHLGEVLRNVLDRPMPRARSIVPALPEAVDEILDRALARERKARPSLAQVAAEFAPFAGREAPALPAPRPVVRALALDETAPAPALGEVAPAPMRDEAAFAPARDEVALTPAQGEVAPAPMRDEAAPTRGETVSAPAADDTSGPGVGGRPVSVERPRPWIARLRSRAGLIVAALGLAAFGAGTYLRPAWRAASSSFGAHGVGSFAVLAPDDALSSEAWAARTIARAVAQRWAGSPGVRVVPPDQAAKVERARAVVRGEAGAARAAAEALGVEALVVVRTAGPSSLARLTIYTRAGDFAGEGERAVEPDPNAPDLFGAAGFVRERLGLGEGWGERGVAALGLPAAPEPLRHALLAERALRDGDVAGAQREIEADGVAAAAIDAPRTQLLWAQIAAAEGRDTTAATLAAGALGKAEHVAGDARLALTAEAHWLWFKLDQAVDEQRALWAARPEATEYGYRLGEMLVERSSFAEAKGVLEGVAGRLTPEGDDGRVAVQLGLARLGLGERERGLQELEAGLARASRAGSAAVAARAEAALAAHLRGADAARAKEHAGRAIAFFAPKGDALGVARAELALAEGALSVERPDEALAAIARARAALHTDEARAIQVASRGVEATVAAQSGDFVKALGATAHALVYAQSPGFPDRVAIARTLIAAAVAERSTLAADRAASHLREALELARGVGHKASAAAALRHLSLGHLSGGALAPAREAAAESVALCREACDRVDLVPSLDALGLVELASDRLAEARKLFEEALRLREAGGLVGGQSRQNLAALLRAEGKPAEAVEACQKAVDELGGRGLVDQKASALALLAELALDAGDQARARAAANGALGLGDDYLRLRTQQALEAILARLDFAAGKSNAPEILEIELMAKKGPGPESLGARLGLGRLWLQAGQPARGRAVLADVAAEARGSGQLELARRAERAAGHGR
jgi:eukaryotic-like serine/threonine-protein kinase